MEIVHFYLIITNTLTKYYLDLSKLKKKLIIGFLR